MIKSIIYFLRYHATCDRIRLYAPDAILLPTDDGKHICVVDEMADIPGNFHHQIRLGANHAEIRIKLNANR